MQVEVGDRLLGHDRDVGEAFEAGVESRARVGLALLGGEHGTGGDEDDDGVGDACAEEA